MRSRQGVNVPCSFLRRRDVGSVNSSGTLPANRSFPHRFATSSSRTARKVYRTAPTDPLTFVGVAAAFLVAGTLACLGLAWRATTVDPMIALRAE